MVARWMTGQGFVSTVPFTAQSKVFRAFAKGVIEQENARQRYRHQRLLAKADSNAASLAPAKGPTVDSRFHPLQGDGHDQDGQTSCETAASSVASRLAEDRPRCFVAPTLPRLIGSFGFYLVQSQMRRVIVNIRR